MPEKEIQKQPAEKSELQKTHRMQPRLNDFTRLLHNPSKKLNQADKDILSYHKNRFLQSSKDKSSVKDLIGSGQLKEDIQHRLDSNAAQLSPNKKRSIV